MGRRQGLGILLAAGQNNPETYHQIIGELAQQLKQLGFAAQNLHIVPPIAKEPKPSTYQTKQNPYQRN